MVDWRYSVDTTDPRYYQWTQWVFLQLYEKGLAYKKKAAVNWCPERQDRARERAGRSPARASAAARRSSSGSWSSGSSASATTRSGCWTTSTASTGRRRTKTAQRNWIGQSRRARRSRFACSDPGAGRVERATSTAEISARSPIRVFTTRPDTIFGATYLVLAPEHPLVDAPNDDEQRDEVEAYRERTARQDLVTRKVDEGEDRRVHRRLRASIPATGAADPDLDRRLRADGVRHRRDHGRARARRARLRVRERRSTCRSCASSRGEGEDAHDAARPRRSPRTTAAAW